MPAVILKAILFLVLLLMVVAGGYTLAQQLLLPEETLTLPANERAVKVQIMVEDLEHPWTAVALPNGRFLVSERSGNLRYVSQNGSLSALLTGVPEIYHAGQG